MQEELHAPISPACGLSCPMARPAHRRGESLQLQRLGSASARLARICAALRNCVRLLVQCLQVQRWSERQATACGVRSPSAERSLTMRLDLCSRKVWPRSGRCHRRSAMMEWQASAADNEESLQLQRLCGGATRPLVASFGHRSALVRSAVLSCKNRAHADRPMFLGAQSPLPAFAPPRRN